MLNLHSMLKVAAGTVAGVLMVAMSVQAQEVVIDEATQACLETCRDTAKDCLFDAREGMKVCLEEAGCNELRDSYRSTCLVEDRDETACSEARTALRACVEPCRTATRDASKACMDAGHTCATEECGVTPPARPTPGAGQGSQGGGRPGRGGGHGGRPGQGGQDL